MCNSDELRVEVVSIFVVRIADMLWCHACGSNLYFIMY